MHNTDHVTRVFIRAPSTHTRLAIAKWDHPTDLCTGMVPDTMHVQQYVPLSTPLHVFVPELPVELWELVTSFMDRTDDGWWVCCISNFWRRWADGGLVVGIDGGRPARIGSVFTSMQRLEAVTVGEFGVHARGMIVHPSPQNNALVTLRPTAVRHAATFGNVDVLDNLYPSWRSEPNAAKFAAGAGRIDLQEQTDFFLHNPDICMATDAHIRKLVCGDLDSSNAVAHVLYMEFLLPSAHQHNSTLLRWLFNRAEATAVEHGIGSRERLPRPVHGHTDARDVQILNLLHHAVTPRTGLTEDYLQALVDYLPLYVTPKTDIVYGTMLRFLVELLYSGSHHGSSWAFCKRYASETLHLSTLMDLLHAASCYGEDAYVIGDGVVNIHEMATRIRHDLLRCALAGTLSWQLQSQQFSGWINTALFESTQHRSCCVDPTMGCLGVSVWCAHDIDTSE